MATLGYNVASIDSDDGNATDTIVMSGGVRTTDGSGGLVGSGWLFVHALGPTGTGTQQKTRLAIYANSAGTPGTVVGVTDEVIITTQAGVWVQYANWTNFGGAPTLAASTGYWVGMWWGTGDGTKITNIWRHTNTLTMFYNTASTYSSSGNPSISGGWTNNGAQPEYDLYFDYAPSGGPPLTSVRADVRFLEVRSH